MHIAMVASLLLPVPPIKYGGTERVIADLITGLSKRGHKITLFTCHGSSMPEIPNLEIIESSPFPILGKEKEFRHYDIHQFVTLLKHQNEFDLLHFHRHPISTEVTIETERANIMSFITKPHIATLHDVFDQDTVNYYRNEDIPTFNMVAVSKSQSHIKRYEGFFKFVDVIYHGLDEKLYEFNPTPKDYLFFIGRFHDIKGPLEAIQVAKKTGRKLIIAAKLEENNSFYEEVIKPEIDGEQIVYMGEANFQEKVELYKNAYATLMPIKWDEPFGLVMIESMATGTPVIAFNRGSIPEVVTNGKTGFIVETVDEMVDAVGKIDSINRKDCRQEVLERFTIDKMAENYEKLYLKIISESEN